MTTVSKADSTLQMKATVSPAEALNKGVTWSVATKSGSAAATIDENGLLTTGGANGVVTVTATSKENSAIAGTCEIKIALPNATAQSEIIEDCSDDKSAKIRKSHGARRVGIIRMQAKLISITAERRRRLSRLEHGSVIHLQEQVLNSMLRK